MPIGSGLRNSHLRAFTPKDEEVVGGKIYRIKTQSVSGRWQTPFQVRPRPIHYRHEVVADDLHTGLRDRGQCVLPRIDEMCMRSGSKFDRIVDRNTFNHGPDEACSENLISSFEHLVQRPRLSSVEMMKRRDDSASPGLLDVIERNRIARPKPSPSLLHDSRLAPVESIGITGHSSGMSKTVPPLHCIVNTPR